MNITHITSLTNNFEAAAHYQEICCSNFKRVQWCLESSEIVHSPSFLYIHIYEQAFYDDIKSIYRDIRLLRIM